jgi:hypothetical protein
VRGPRAGAGAGGGARPGPPGGPPPPPAGRPAAVGDAVRRVLSDPDRTYPATVVTTR